MKSPIDGNVDLEELWKNAYVGQGATVYIHQFKDTMAHTIVAIHKEERIIVTRQDNVIWNSQSRYPIFEKCQKSSEISWHLPEMAGGRLKMFPTYIKDRNDPRRSMADAIIIGYRSISCEDKNRSY